MQAWKDYNDPEAGYAAVLKTTLKKWIFRWTSKISNIPVMKQKQRIFEYSTRWCLWGFNDGLWRTRKGDFEKLGKRVSIQIDKDGYAIEKSKEWTRGRRRRFYCADDYKICLILLYIGIEAFDGL